MNAVTYSDEKVIKFLNSEVIPVQITFDTQPLASKYNLLWTPTIIVLDGQGKEYDRNVGYISPEEFIPFIILGIGKAYFELDNFEKAIESFRKIIEYFPKSKATAQAIYFIGVSKYKHTHEPKHLKESYELLKTKFPDSEWTLKAEPYNLL